MSKDQYNFEAIEQKNIQESESFWHELNNVNAMTSQERLFKKYNYRLINT